MIGTLLHKLTPLQGFNKVIKITQSVGDIISGILNTHNYWRGDYDKICLNFNEKTPYLIGKKIFDFLKGHTHYVIESDSHQTLRSPAAILKLGSDKKIGLDCKSYSLFIGGILDALNRKGKNINWCYRFASYKFTDKLPHHVFVVINPVSSKEIWIDPVLPLYNEKKQYFYKVDRKPKNMALVQVSGIGRRKKTKAERKQRRQQIKKTIKEKIKKRGKLLLKFNPATVPARNAFLLIVKLNVLNIAFRLKQLLQKDQSKLKKFWEGIGGSWNSLVKNIEVGYRKKAKKLERKSNRIGETFTATAAAVVSATPIIIKVVRLLKDNGIDAETLVEAGKTVVRAVASKKIDDQAAAQETAETLEETGEAEPMDGETDFESENETESENDGEDF
jgi:hypothetical protein